MQRKKSVALMLKIFDKPLLYLLLPLCWVVNSSMLSKKIVAPHPFYVSVTEINHNAGEKTLEISCKMFAEDVEEVASKNFKTPIDLSAAAQEKAGRFIDKYMRQHLQLQADGKPVSLKFIGFEKEAEAVYCYFEGGGVGTVKKLSLTNSVLQDFSTDQINIVHVTVAGNRKSTRLNYPDKAATFVF